MKVLCFLVLFEAFSIGNGNINFGRSAKARLGSFFENSFINSLINCIR